LKPWLEQKGFDLLIRIRVQPRAAKTQIAGLHGEPPRLKIRIAAPPVDDAANEECIEFLSGLLRRPKSSIELVAGHKSKMKDFLCRGLDLSEAQQKLI